MAQIDDTIATYLTAIEVEGKTPVAPIVESHSDWRVRRRYHDHPLRVVASSEGTFYLDHLSAKKEVPKA